MYRGRELVPGEVNIIAEKKGNGAEYFIFSYHGLDMKEA